jgi:hypothetical protein
VSAESQLSVDEVANLDRLLAQVDQLTILKTRARYTLHCLKNIGIGGREAYTVPLPKTSSTAYYRRGDGNKLSICLLVFRVISLISVRWSSERF